MEEGQGLTFWDFCAMLGLCFLCWLVATLMLKLSVRLSHKTNWVKMLAWATLAISVVLGYLLGLPVTIVMWFFSQHEFMKNSKIASRACTIGREYEAYQRFVESNNLGHDSFYYEVRSKYNAFRYYYCMGNEGDGKYQNNFKSYSDYKGRSFEERDIMDSLNFQLEELENGRLNDEALAFRFHKKKKRCK